MITVVCRAEDVTRGKGRERLGIEAIQKNTGEELGPPLTVLCFDFGGNMHAKKWNCLALFSASQRHPTLVLRALLAGMLICRFSIATAETNTYKFYRCNPTDRRTNTSSLAPVSWVSIKNKHVVLQRHDYSCGAGALATLLTYYWNDPTGEADILTDLENYLTAEDVDERIKNGLSMSDLKNISILRGYRAIVGKLNGLQDLAAVKVPVIVAISVQEGNHFVVVRGVVGNEIYLADPTRGNTRMPLDVFAKHWVHNAVLAVLHKDMDLSPASRLTIPYAEIDPQYPNRPYVRRMMNPFLP